MTIYTLLTDARTSDQRLADLLTALDTADLPADRREACRRMLLDARRPTITWASPAPGLHVVDGQRIDSSLIGLTAAHLAMCSQGRQLVRAADLATPGASRPANAVRNSLRVAARFMGRYSLRAAAAIRLVRVVDGFVVYQADGRWDIEASV